MLMDKWLTSRKVSQQLFSSFTPTLPHLHIPRNTPNRAKLPPAWFWFSPWSWVAPLNPGILRKEYTIQKFIPPHRSRLCLRDRLWARQVVFSLLSSSPATGHCDQPEHRHHAMLEACLVFKPSSVSQGGGLEWQRSCELVTVVSEDGVGAWTLSGYVVLGQTAWSSISRPIFLLGQSLPKSEQFFPPPFPSSPPSLTWILATSMNLPRCSGFQKQATSSSFSSTPSAGLHFVP